MRMSAGTVAIITWNRRDDLALTLAHCEAYRANFSELLVLDNGSTDGTEDMVRARFPWVRFVRSVTPQGVDAARNAAIIAAAEDAVLCVDDDGYFDFTALPSLLQRLGSRPEVAVIGCRVVDDSSARGRVPDFARFAGPHSFRERADFWGTAFLVHKERFLDAGGFPSDFVYSNEERDASYRCIARGYVVEYAPHAVMIHFKTATNRPPTRAVRFHARNRIREIWRNVPMPFAITETLIVILGGLLRNARRRRFGAYLSGTWSGVRLAVQDVRTGQRRPIGYRRYQGYYRKLEGAPLPLRRRIRRFFQPAATRF